MLIAFLGFILLMVTSSTCGGCVTTADDCRQMCGEGRVASFAPASVTYSRDAMCICRGESRLVDGGTP